MIPFERQVNETLWYAIMLEKYQGSEPYTNEVFEIKPFSWGDEENDWHFWHKPSGFKLSWYKYPLRGVEANMDITHEQFYAVLQDCMNSIPEHNTPYITIHNETFKRWWT